MIDFEKIHSEFASEPSFRIETKKGKLEIIEELGLLTNILHKP